MRPLNDTLPFLTFAAGLSGSSALAETPVTAERLNALITGKPEDH